MHLASCILSVSSHGKVSPLPMQAIEEAQAEAAKSAAEVQRLRQELAMAQLDVAISADADVQ